MALSDADASLIGAVLVFVNGPLALRVYRDWRKAKKKVVAEVHDLLDAQYRSEIQHLRDELADEKAQNAALMQKLFPTRGDPK